MADPIRALPPSYIDTEHQGEDLELLQTFYRACQAEGGTADEIHLRGLRAVLAARPTSPATPLEGEVAELVAWLRRQAGKWQAIDRESGLTRSLVAEHFTRAAALLSIAYATGEESWEPVAQLPAQRHPAPVPVSERMPGPEDCDEQGRCWVHQPHEACPESPAWELMLAKYASLLVKYASPNYEAMCWLPAHALPLPAVEVQP